MKGLSILLGIQLLLFTAMLVSAVEMKERIERGVEDYYERMRRGSEKEMLGDVSEERRALDDDDDDYKGLEASENRKDEKIKRAVSHVATDRIDEAAENSVDEDGSSDSEEISDDERMNTAKVKEKMKPYVEDSPDDKDSMYRASAEGPERKIRALDDSENNRMNIAGGVNFKDRLIKAIEKKQQGHHNKAKGSKMKKHKKKTADNTKEKEKRKTAAVESVTYERVKRAVNDLINKAAHDEDEDKDRMRRAWR
ncbi:DEAD-box ATP-dependent RNA helicase 42-like [Polyodon spathula]|uniref:DEAD-box ATP-dependent RNA helicase 42-like n=1 Tax=Polyodon spathula TaxID=7913 RepID=UPI001B7E2406|nr:DEAD-box ATP-dependent RNA helicase 42-like [Polyodon spathula]